MIYRKIIIVLVFVMGLSGINAQTLVSGKVSLEKSENRIFTVSKSDGISKEIDLRSENHNKISGILAVLFDDCSAMRDDLFRTDTYTERILVKFVNQYNSCVYSDYAPTEKEIENANRFNTDQFKFYGGFGTSFVNIRFFDNDNKESLNQFGLKIGVTASPNFVGPLQGNFYFNFQASLNFAGEKDFNSSRLPTSFSVHTYRLILGTEFYFNKNGRIKPFLGVGIGLTEDKYKGNVDGNKFKIDGGNPIWMPKIGVLYALKNGKDIGVTLDYIPDFDNNLSFPIDDDEIIPLLIKSNYLNASLNFYF